MENITRTPLGELHEKISIRLEKETYLPVYQQSLKNYARKASFPGFRKGHVPISYLQKILGKSLMAEETSRLAQSRLEEYLKEEKLLIINSPVETSTPIESLDPGQPKDLDFEYEIGLAPEVPEGLPGLKGPYTLYKVSVTDEEVESYLEDLRIRIGTRESIDQIRDDRDLIRGEWRQEGQENEGEAPAYFELFSHLPEILKEKVRNIKCGDQLEFRPFEEITDEESRSRFLKELGKDFESLEPGQSIHFTLLEITHLEPAEENEEFFKSLFPDSEITTREQAMEWIRQSKEAVYKIPALRLLLNEVFQDLRDGLDFPLPLGYLKTLFSRRTGSPVEDEFIDSMAAQYRWSFFYDSLIERYQIKAAEDFVREYIRRVTLNQIGGYSQANVHWVEEYVNSIKKDSETYRNAEAVVIQDQLIMAMKGDLPLREEVIRAEDLEKILEEKRAHNHNHDHGHDHDHSHNHDSVLENEEDQK